MAVKRFRTKDATKPLKFGIIEKHICEASPGDPGNCVVACAVRDALGDMFDSIEVGAHVTKVYVNNQCIR